MMLVLFCFLTVEFERGTERGPGETKKVVKREEASFQSKEGFESMRPSSHPFVFRPLSVALSSLSPSTKIGTPTSQARPCSA